MPRKTTKYAILATVLAVTTATPSLAQEYYPAENGAWDNMAVGTTDAYVLTPGSDWIDTYMPPGPQTSHDFTTWQPSGNESTTEIMIFPDYSSEVFE